MQRAPHKKIGRTTFLGGMAASAGYAVLGGSSRDAAADNVVPGSCTDTLQVIIDTALVAELLAATFYYTGLTTQSVVRDPALLPYQPGAVSAAIPEYEKYLRAALDAEVKHAVMLRAGGAKSTISHFYFPATTFQRAGSPRESGTFFFLLEQLETAFVNAYGVAVSQCLLLKRPDLAELTARIMGVEAEHRTLGRAITRTLPPNDLALERVPYACVSEVGATLAAFVTGKGFTGKVSPPIPVPSKQETDLLIGSYRTRIVEHFL